MSWVVLSVGGSLIVPDKPDPNFLKKFKAMLKPLLKKNRYALVIGGGKTARTYMQAAKQAAPRASDTIHDLIGIKATHLNEQLVYAVFEKEADKNILTKKPKSIKTKKRLLLAAGWDVGASTDYNAVQLAGMLKSKTVINLTNVDYVYNKNPKKFKNAKPIKDLTWKQFKKIIGGKWSPGANVPFDPIASRLAEKLKLNVVVINGNNLNNVKKCLEGKPYKGTLIHS